MLKFLRSYSVRYDQAGKNSYGFGPFQIDTVERLLTLAELTRAQELDSRSLVFAAGIGWRHYYAGDYDRAIQQCQKALDLDPNFALLIAILGMAYLQSKRTAEAINTLKGP